MTLVSVTGGVKANAENTYVQQDGVNYCISGSYAIVCPPENRLYEGVISIPANITIDEQSYRVRLGFGAFAGSDIVSITIPENITWTKIPGSTPSGSLAQSSFTIGDSNSNTKLTDIQINENVASLGELMEEEFGTCEKLERIYTESSQGEVSESGCIFYITNNAKNYPYTRSILAYVPKQIKGTVDFSNVSNFCYFESQKMWDRPLIEKIIFPNYFSNFNYTGFKGCTKLSEFGIGTTGNSSYSVKDGILYSGNTLIGFPPAPKATYHIDNNVLGGYAFAYCNIENLELENVSVSSYNNNIETVFLDFKGNIDIITKVAPTANILESLANTDSEDYTLKCDPRDQETASLYWKGKIENNDLYIDNVEVGYTSVKVTFGGKRDVISNIIDVRLYNSSKYYGNGERCKDGGSWMISDLKPGAKYYDIYVAVSDANEIGRSFDKRFNQYSVELLTPEFKFENTERKSTVIETELIYPSVEGLNDWSSLEITSSDAYLEKEGNHIKLYGLAPNTTTKLNITCKEKNESNYSEIKIEMPALSTKPVKFKLDYEITQRTLTMNSYTAEGADETWPEVKSWSTGEGYYHSYEFGETVKVTPDVEIGIYFVDDYFFKKEVQIERIKTESLINKIIFTPTTIEVDLKEGDAEVYQIKYSYKLFSTDTYYRDLVGNQDVLNIISGLNPGRSFAVLAIDIYYETPTPQNYGYRRFTYQNVKIPALDLETLMPKVAEGGKAIVAANTNISENEPSVGFMWKKYDAPASLAPSQAFSVIYDGRLEGVIKNLSLNNYYTLDSFYKAYDGTYYYGGSITFDPSDHSYFEPTIHTYETMTVEHNSALIKAYILSGSEDIEEQGFEYGPVETTTKSGVYQVIGNGQIMECLLTDLEPDTKYFVKAYVKTGNKTYYGEEKTFTTKYSAGTGVNMAEDESMEAPELIGRFNMGGQPVGEHFKGIVIEVYSNGKTRKVLQQ